MRYMVVETFRHDAEPVYARAAERGRMLPEGLEYIDSWVSDDLHRCWQLMETDDPSLFEVWLDHWRDLGTFEVVAVITSAEAAGRVGERWSGDAGAGPP